MTKKGNQKMNLTAKEKHNLLVQTGREIAESLMESAVTSAENPEQMSNQIFSLQIAALHILATCAYNLERNNGKDGNTFIDSFCRDMKSELTMIKSAPEKVEMLKCKRPMGVVQ